MDIAILVNILTGVCIVILMMIRRASIAIDTILSIVDKQTKSINLIHNRGNYHEKVLSFISESIKPAIDYVWTHGSDQDRKEISDIINKYNKKVVDK